MKTKKQPEQAYLHWKVIRIYWTWAESKKDAVKRIQEEEPEPEVEFAVEEKPKGWLGTLFKQIVG
jgi:hypothetical protein